MGRIVAEKYQKRFVQLGIVIASLRKVRGLSQSQLALQSGISRSLISAIEAPGMACNYTLETLFDIAEVLEIDPADLLRASLSPTISSIRRIAENSFLADHSQLFAFLSSNREGTTALRAVAPSLSLYLCV